MYKYGQEEPMHRKNLKALNNVQKFFPIIVLNILFINFFLKGNAFFTISNKTQIKNIF